MAHTLSANKRIRQSEKRRLKNKSAKSELKTYIKKYESALVAKDLDQSQLLLKKTVSLLDKSAKSKLIHKNKASRKTSSLVKKFNALKNQAN